VLLLAMLATAGDVHSSLCQTCWTLRCAVLRSSAVATQVKAAQRKTQGASA